jgi:hypothetical protein
LRVLKKVFIDELVPLKREEREGRVEKQSEKETENYLLSELMVMWRDWICNRANFEFWLCYLWLCDLAKVLILCVMFLQ